MIDLDEVSRTIAELETRGTTYATCEKLAILYAVRDHFEKETLTGTGSKIYTGGSEFLRAVSCKNNDSVWSVMDELMESLRLVQPKVYDGVMRKLYSL